HILVIAIGGAHVKFRVDARGPVRKFVSGPQMSPASMTRQLLELTGNLSFDALSIGYPGLVFRGRIAAEPHNLGAGWVGFDFHKAFGRPVKVINDAAVQSIGSYSGGRMLFLGLGTGLGATLVIDGVVEPTEVGHMPYKRGRTFEDYVGERGRRRLGTRKWRRKVLDVIEHLKLALEVDYVVLGGGNAVRLKSLPRDVHLGDNRNAFICGLRLSAPGVPAVHIVHHHERFDLRLRVAPCEHRDVLLVEVVLDGDAALRPYALLAPHLGGTGANNRAAVVQHRGRKLLWAEQGPFGLALAAVNPRQQDAWGRASAGFVGSSDGWQDFARNGALTWEYDAAGPGNVALLGELPRQAVLALGFGSSPEAAATLSLTALSEPFAISWERQRSSWTLWHTNCTPVQSLCAGLPPACAEQVGISTMVLRTHQDKTYPGAMVASLSVPWGNTREEREGYHLVWPRDLVESAGALLAVGAAREARNTLRYLLATQNADGHWHQNQWLGGKVYWPGVQLDESAFPVLLAVALDERGALEGTEVADMIRRALSFLVRHGPVSDQDRW